MGRAIVRNTQRDNLLQWLMGTGSVMVDEAARAWQLSLPPTAALINCAWLRPDGCLLAIQCDPDRCAILDLTGIPQHAPAQVAHSSSLTQLSAA